MSFLSQSFFSFFSVLYSSYTASYVHCPHSRHAALCFLLFACNILSLLTLSPHFFMSLTYLSNSSPSYLLHVTSPNLFPGWVLCWASPSPKHNKQICDTPLPSPTTVGSEFTLTASHHCTPRTELSTRLRVFAARLNYSYLALSCAFLSLDPLRLLHHVILNLEFSR